GSGTFGRSAGAQCRVPNELDFGGSPHPRDSALHPVHCAPASLLEKRDANECGYVRCPQFLPSRRVKARIGLDILDDNRPPCEKFLDQRSTVVCKHETLDQGSVTATPGTPGHDLSAADFPIAASVHAEMLAHHPAHGRLDSDGLGMGPQRVA